MSESADVIVVGGGISGFGFAYRAARAGRDVVVLEGRERLGGCLNTERHASGFWLELGAHTAYNSYGGFIELLEACGLLESLMPRAKVPFRLLEDGRVRSIGKALDVLEILRSAPRGVFGKRDGRTVADYYGGLVGARNYARVLGPLLSAVPSQRADGMPATMLFKKRPRDKRVRKSFTLAGGLGTVIDAAAKRERVRAVASAEVTGIARQGAGFVVTCADERRFEAGHVAVATPPGAATRLLSDAHPALARTLARVRSAPVATTGVVIARERLAHLEPVAGLVPLDDDTYWSAVSRDTVPHGRFRGFAFHFRPGLAEDERLARITNALGVGRDGLEHVAEAAHVLPAPVLGHEQIVRAIDDHLAGGRLAVTGSYFAGLAIEDCVGRSFAEAERLLG